MTSMPLALSTLSPASTAQAGGGGFFDVASRRLDYIDQRQRVLAQNIANADTPDYQPRDLKPFDAFVTDATIAPAQTNPLHLAGTTPSVSQIVQTAAARDPDGNTVDIETQLTKVADDETSAALVGNLWKTTMGMYLTALGRGG
jgi:flagellar basal-body rod protein FlgB